MFLLLLINYKLISFVYHFSFVQLVYSVSITKIKHLWIIIVFINKNNLFQDSSTGTSCILAFYNSSRVAGITNCIYSIHFFVYFRYIPTATMTLYYNFREYAVIYDSTVSEFVPCLLALLTPTVMYIQIRNNHNYYCTIPRAMQY